MGLKLPIDRDFNVPSPLIVDDKLFIVSENNGALLYQIPNASETSGSSAATLKLIAQTDELSHDSNSLCSSQITLRDSRGGSVARSEEQFIPR